MTAKLLPAALLLTALACDSDDGGLDSGSTGSDSGAAVDSGGGFRLSGSKDAVASGERADLVVLDATNEGSGTVVLLTPVEAGGVGAGTVAQTMGLRAARPVALDFTDVQAGSEAVLAAGAEGALQDGLASAPVGG